MFLSNPTPDLTQQQAWRQRCGAQYRGGDSGYCRCTSALGTETKTGFTVQIWVKESLWRLSGWVPQVTREAGIPLSASCNWETFLKSWALGPPLIHKTFNYFEDKNYMCPPASNLDLSKAMPSSVGSSMFQKLFGEGRENSKHLRAMNAILSQHPLHSKQMMETHCIARN